MRQTHEALAQPLQSGGERGWSAGGGLTEPAAVTITAALRAAARAVAGAGITTTSSRPLGAT
jgi:hypothetical protein